MIKKYTLISSCLKQALCLTLLSEMPLFIFKWSASKSISLSDFAIKKSPVYRFMIRIKAALNEPYLKNPRPFQEYWNNFRIFVFTLFMGLTGFDSKVNG
jgi:hypothetical protein